MSRCVSIVNDELELRHTIGQGWDGFYIWETEDTILGINYMLNRALDTLTDIRVVDEYYGTQDSWSDPNFVDPDAKIWGYKEPSDAEMKQWLADNHPRYYKPSVQPEKDGDGKR